MRNNLAVASLLVASLLCLKLCLCAVIRNAVLQKNDQTLLAACYESENAFYFKFWQPLSSFSAGAAFGSKCSSYGAIANCFVLETRHRISKLINRLKITTEIDGIGEVQICLWMANHVSNVNSLEELASIQLTPLILRINRENSAISVVSKWPVRKVALWLGDDMSPHSIESWRFGLQKNCKSGENFGLSWTQLSDGHVQSSITYQSKILEKIRFNLISSEVQTESYFVTVTKCFYPVSVDDSKSVDSLACVDEQIFLLKNQDSLSSKNSSLACIAPGTVTAISKNPKECQELLKESNVMAKNNADILKKESSGNMQKVPQNAAELEENSKLNSKRRFCESQDNLNEESVVRKQQLNTNFKATGSLFCKTGAQTAFPAEVLEPQFKIEIYKMLRKLISLPPNTFFAQNKQNICLKHAEILQNQQKNAPASEKLPLIPTPIYQAVTTDQNKMFKYFAEFNNLGSFHELWILQVFWLEIFGVNYPSNISFIDVRMIFSLYIGYLYERKAADFINSEINQLLSISNMFSPLESLADKSAIMVLNAFFENGIDWVTGKFLADLFGFSLWKIEPKSSSKDLDFHENSSDFIINVVNFDNYVDVFVTKKTQKISNPIEIQPSRLRLVQALKKISEMYFEMKSQNVFVLDHVTELFDATDHYTNSTASSTAQISQRHSLAYGLRFQDGDFSHFVRSEAPSFKIYMEFCTIINLVKCTPNIGDSLRKFHRFAMCFLVEPKLPFLKDHFKFLIEESVTFATEKANSNATEKEEAQKLFKFLQKLMFYDGNRKDKIFENIYAAGKDGDPVELATKHLAVKALLKFLPKKTLISVFHRVFFRFFPTTSVTQTRHSIPFTQRKKTFSHRKCLSYPQEVPISLFPFSNDTSTRSLDEPGSELPKPTFYTLFGVFSLINFETDALYRKIVRIFNLDFWQKTRKIFASQKPYLTNMNLINTLLTVFGYMSLVAKDIFERMIAKEKPDVIELGKCVAQATKNFNQNLKFDKKISDCFYDLLVNFYSTETLLAFNMMNLLPIENFSSLNKTFSQKKELIYSIIYRHYNLKCNHSLNEVIVKLSAPNFETFEAFAEALKIAFKPLAELSLHLLAYNAKHCIEYIDSSFMYFDDEKMKVLSEIANLGLIELKGICILKAIGDSLNSIHQTLVLQLKEEK